MHANVLVSLAVLSSYSPPLLPPYCITLLDNYNKLILACFAQTVNNGSDKKGRSAGIVEQALSTVLLGLTSFCNYVFPGNLP